MLANNTVVCSDYLFGMELIFHFSYRTRLEHLAVLIGGMVAVCRTPAVLFGIVSCWIMLALFTCKIGLAQHLHLWVALSSGTDLVFISTFSVFSENTYIGSTWWRISHFPGQFHNYSLCRYLNCLNDFALSLRIIFTYFLVLDFVTYNPTGNFAARRSKVWLFALTSVALAVITSSSTAMIYGLWQHDGVFLCAPDPFWPSVQHSLYWIHHLCLVDGLVPCLCISVLCWILYRQMQWNNQFLLYLQQTPDSDSLPGLIKIGRELELQDFERNASVVLTHAQINCFCRLGSCSVKCVWYALYGVLTYGSNSHSMGMCWRIAMIIKESVWEFWVCVEVILVSFSILWWMCRLPKMQQETTVSKGRRSCSDQCHCVKERINARYYFEQAMKQNRGAQGQVRQRYLVLDHLRELKKNLYKMHEQDLTSFSLISKSSKATTIDSLKTFEREVRRRSTMSAVSFG